MKYLFIFLLFLSFYTFPKDEKDRGYPLTIHVENGKESSHSLSDYARNIVIIPLSFDGQEIIIGGIEKIDFDSVHIYVLHHVAVGEAKRLSVFTRDGEFIKTIYTVSLDSGPTYNIKSFLIEAGKLTLFSQDGYSVTFHSRTLRKWYYNKKLPFHMNNVYKVNGHYIFHTNNIAFNQEPDSLLYSFIVTDSAFRIENKMMKFQILAFHSYSRSQLNGNIQEGKANNLLYRDFLGPNIYSVNIDSTFAKYRVDFGHYTVDTSLVKKENRVAFSPQLMKSYMWGLSCPIEFDGGLLFSFYKKKVPLNAVWLQKGKLVLFNPYNDLNNQNVLPWPKGKYCDRYYGWFQEGGFNMIADNIPNYSKQSVVRQSFRYLKLNHNPVIVMYTLDFSTIKE